MIELKHQLLHDCDDCNIIRRDPIADELYLFLHAFEYSWEDYSFKTGEPDWVKESYKDSECLHIKEQLDSQKEFLLTKEPLKEYIPQVL